MQILVDADSCPRAARALVLRAAERTGIRAVFAANRPVPGITGKIAVLELCPQGEGAADNRIVELARRGDLAVTRDIPLAARLVEAGVSVIDDRGREYTPDNIREQLSLRNISVEFALSGLGVERSASYGRKELKAMSDSLDRLLTKLIKESPLNGRLQDRGSVSV
ncbi:MAG: DUF188 domain-containing protein [Treponema sp.]|jgi:uncharacterized protein YaiI (UPF0178 family)|nr:DUF188 domain-containing protein [Treponema sp.]